MASLNHRKSAMSRTNLQLHGYNNGGKETISDSASITYAKITANFGLERIPVG
jgi:hypothetical protein